MGIRKSIIDVPFTRRNTAIIVAVIILYMVGWSILEPKLRTRTTIITNDRVGFLVSYPMTWSAVSFESPEGDRRYRLKYLRLRFNERSLWQHYRMHVFAREDDNPALETAVRWGNELLSSYEIIDSSPPTPLAHPKYSMWQQTFQAQDVQIKHIYVVETQHIFVFQLFVYGGDPELGFSIVEHIALSLDIIPPPRAGS